MSTIKKRGLGRGLATLLSDLSVETVTTHKPVSTQTVLQTLPMDVLQRGKYQPRKTMDQAALQELAISIKTSGIIQPLVVRHMGSQRYEIIAGERRWRAAQLAGLSEVPVIIKEIDDHQASALALIENIQREDLNPLEEAQALERLIQEFDLTHEAVANLVGKSRVTITNLLRILNLNPDVQKLLEQNKIELGHAKALLALTGTQQTQAATQSVSLGFSVRELERYIHHLQTSASPKKQEVLPADIRHLQTRLSEKLGAKVTLTHSEKGKGTILICYNNLDELDGILNHFNLK